ncbi:MAG: hypothetical protein QG650_845, partial [Patescibacteria group bacterium]|nr:hypothetical protein [Patescibacteria group bacterium]
MSQFRDHLKAEIFSETFSKIFFSGPAGRGVAIMFVLVYGSLKMVVLTAIAAFSFLGWTFGRVLTTYRSTERATAKRAFRELKISALRFGDAYESGES